MLMSLAVGPGKMPRVLKPLGVKEVKHTVRGVARGQSLPITHTLGRVIGQSPVCPEDYCHIGVDLAACYGNVQGSPPPTNMRASTSLWPSGLPHQEASMDRLGCGDHTPGVQQKTSQVQAGGKQESSWVSLGQYFISL